MARPKNTEAEKKIFQSGFRLLLEEGYESTSYRAIAEASGQSRAFVQHYIPKKELLLERFIERLLDIFDERAAGKRNACDPYESMVLTGQLYFAFLFDERVRPLSIDILQDRSACESVIAANEIYQAHKAHTSPSEQQQLSDELARIIGGSYEVVYRCLLERRSLDPLAESLRIVCAYADLVGDDGERIAERLSACAFNDEEIDAILDSVLAELKTG